MADARLTIRAKAMLKIARLLDLLLPEERQTVAFDVYQAYGGGDVMERQNGAARQARFRARRNGDVTPDVTPDVTLDVTPKVTPSPAPPASRALELLGFSSFWSKYPKRVGKGDTLRSWKKNGCENRAVSIIESLEKQLPYLTREGGQFIPNPATWLNQGRWDDDPPTTLPGVSKNAQATIKNLDAFVHRKSTP